MIEIVTPVLAVVLIGYLDGRRTKHGQDAERLVNDYVLYVALPALLFLALARTEPEDLMHGGFVLATLAGIVVAYLAGVAVQFARGVRLPEASIAGMAACYGTTGYMGVPILIAAFGAKAAVPAAIATILHNIPAIVTVVLTHDLCANKNMGLGRSIAVAVRTTVRNPLVVAVAAGGAIALLEVPLPDLVENFAGFLGAAAGPTALFALGLGLSRLRLGDSGAPGRSADVTATVLVKVLLQPAVTLAALLIPTGPEIDIWFVAALVMAAQPVGADAYVFAVRYGNFRDEVSLSIVASLLVTMATVTVLLEVLAPLLVR